MKEQESGTLRNAIEWRAGAPAFLLSFFVAIFLAAGLHQTALAVGLVVVATTIGVALDFARAQKTWRAKRQAASAKWEPVLANGTAEHVKASATAGTRIDDNEANTAWFLQVESDLVLCVWDWADDATENVEVVRVADSETTLKIDWSGNKLKPVCPKRKFKRGEKQPAQCAVLNGDVRHLDELLKAAKGSKGKAAERAPQPQRDEPRAQLASRISELGFYKYLDEVEPNDAAAAADEGAYSWFMFAERAFDADAERLAEGGVADLLDYLRPALTKEGVALGPIEQTYDAENGYCITVNGKKHDMWNRAEAKRSWELTTLRSAGLVNDLLDSSGSKERVFLMNGGEDGVFVLLTPEMLSNIEQSHAFPRAELPGPLA